MDPSRTLRSLRESQNLAAVVHERTCYRCRPTTSPVSIWPEALGDYQWRFPSWLFERRELELAQRFADQQPRGGPARLEIVPMSSQIEWR